jgi:hypothetical protein
VIAGLSSKPSLIAGGATRRTIQVALGPAREATTRNGVRPIPFVQMDFSTNATY